MEQERIKIVPIQNGLTNATRVDLIWLSKAFFSDKLVLRLELTNDDKEYQHHIDVHMNYEEYLSKGLHKEERASTILNENGIFLLEENT